jgi:hypothetical protein
MGIFTFATVWCCDNMQLCVTNNSLEYSASIFRVQGKLKTTVCQNHYIYIYIYIAQFYFVKFNVIQVPEEKHFCLKASVKGVIKLI